MTAPDVRLLAGGEVACRATGGAWAQSDTPWRCTDGSRLRDSQIPADAVRLVPVGRLRELAAELRRDGTDLDDDTQPYGDAVDRLAVLLDQLTGEEPT